MVGLVNIHWNNWNLNVKLFGALLIKTPVGIWENYTILIEVLKRKQGGDNENCAHKYVQRDENAN